MKSESHPLCLFCKTIQEEDDGNDKYDNQWQNKWKKHVYYVQQSDYVFTWLSLVIFRLVASSRFSVSIAQLFLRVGEVRISSDDRILAYDGCMLLVQ